MTTINKIIIYNTFGKRDEYGHLNNEIKLNILLTIARHFVFNY